MMAQLVAIHAIPADAETYRRHYFETHVPLVQRLPGLRKYQVSDGPVGVPGAGPPAFLVAVMHFKDLASISRALASPEGKAAAADMPNFAAEGDIQLLMFECRNLEL